ncbi:MAG: hypothetical protein ABJA83_04700 [Burkholderiaceae bacterium]
MKHALWNHEALSRLKVNGSVFKVDDEVAVQDKKELIVADVLVPVVFALHHPESDDRPIHLTERLVVPRVLAGSDKRRDVDKSRDLTSKCVA